MSVTLFIILLLIIFSVLVFILKKKNKIALGVSALISILLIACITIPNLYKLNTNTSNYADTNTESYSINLEDGTKYKNINDNVYYSASLPRQSGKDLLL